MNVIYLFQNGVQLLERCEETFEKLCSFVAMKSELRQTHPLKYLFWESTLRCNLCCLHCGSDCVKDNSTLSKEIAPEVIKRELQSIAEAYDSTEITFAIIGGEPLIRLEEIVEVGRFASELGYFWGITTNGMLLSCETISKLKEANLKTIAVSLDGIESDHNQLRDSGNSYELVTAGIMRLLDDPFYEKMDIICCVSKINIHNLEKFVEAMINLHVPAIRFTPIFARGRGGENSNLHLSNADLTYLLQFIADKRQTESRIDITLSEEGYYGPQWECNVRDSMHYCGSGITVGTILYDGKVTGCPSVSRDYIEGSINDASFVELWNREFQCYRNHRQELFGEQCSVCDNWILCEGGGFHLLKQENIETGICQYKKIGSNK